MANEIEWFYTEGRTRKGPISQAQLKKLFKSERLSRNTRIWHKKMKRWLPAHETDFADDLPSIAPLAPELIGNGLVWILALLPIAYGVMNNLFWWHTFEHPNEDATLLNILRWAIIFGLSTALCLYDEKQLEDAGYGSDSLKKAALILTPAYLFMRAKALD